MSQAVRSYLLETLLPFWAQQAWDEKDGGYLSELTLTGAPVPEPMRACLVQSRCLYSFSHAAVLGGEAWAMTAARRAFDVLRSRMRHESGLWVAAAALQPDGPRDERLDFYDQAFVLFALGWWHRASGDATAIALAGETWDALEASLADPQAGGWRDDMQGRLPRRQNPHMHLLEAMHALFEATGNPAWLTRADRIVTLFLECFYDSGSDTVREFLTADLRPAAGEAGLLREPGHSMEWVWLLLHHHRLSGDGRVLPPAEALYTNACRFGVDAGGHVVETMTADGQMRDRSHLLWPQMEAVKAALARQEMLAIPAGDAKRFLAVVWRDHLSEASPLWVNRLTAEGQPLTDRVPTRLLYHIVLCLAEYLRLTPEQPSSVGTAMEAATP
jgi:mannose/cellobiose epimerase-like protein (N-acyl-D-glucosamine 2-epimerase family)